MPEPLELRIGGAVWASSRINTVRVRRRLKTGELRFALVQESVQERGGRACWEAERGKESDGKEDWDLWASNTVLFYHKWCVLVKKIMRDYWFYKDGAKWVLRKMKKRKG